MIRLLTVASLVLAAAIVVKAHAQAPPPQKVVSTATGVYTAAQASKGERVYNSYCLSCHPAGSYTTPAFREKWNGHLVSELFSFISNQMPKEQPGTLEDADYINVIAYLLKINGSPAGKKDLPADEKALKWIRISMN